MEYKRQESECMGVRVLSDREVELFCLRLYLLISKASIDSFKQIVEGVSCTTLISKGRC